MYHVVKVISSWLSKLGNFPQNLVWGKISDFPNFVHFRSLLGVGWRRFGLATNLWELLHTTHTTVLLLVWNMSGSTRVSRYQKGKTTKVKTNLDLLKQEIVSGSGICWAICESAPHAYNHANTPPLSFLQAGCPSWRPTNSVKALKEVIKGVINKGKSLPKT